MWWRDCSARELLAGYGGRTVRTGVEGTIDRIDPARLERGDLAITADGVHCLAYLGERQWIEADPYLDRVVTRTAPDASFAWFTRPVVIVRWSRLVP